MEANQKHLRQLEKKAMKLAVDITLLNHQLVAVKEEIAKFKHDTAQVVCLQCGCDIGAKKHHQFKAGVVCNSCFLGPGSNLKRWNGEEDNGV
jgi:hypothetical protein